jgi:hypothetical protein
LPGKQSTKRERGFGEDYWETHGFPNPSSTGKALLSDHAAERSRVDLRGGAVLKTLLMKTRQHGGLFVF